MLRPILMSIRTPTTHNFHVQKICLACSIHMCSSEHERPICVLKISNFSTRYYRIDIQSNNITQKCIFDNNTQFSFSNMEMFILWRPNKLRSCHLNELPLSISDSFGIGLTLSKSNFTRHFHTLRNCE